MGARESRLGRVGGEVAVFLNQVARPRSGFGGGSAAALTAALAAALLEKVAGSGRERRKLRAIRRRCAGFVDADAKQFARVVAVLRAGSRLRAARALRGAIEIPCRVCEAARDLQAAAAHLERQVPPRWRSDVRCAGALARAAAESARALGKANLAWVNDPAYSRGVMRRLRVSSTVLRRRSGGSSVRGPVAKRRNDQEGSVVIGSPGHRVTGSLGQ